MAIAIFSTTLKESTLFAIGAWFVSISLALLSSYVLCGKAKRACILWATLLIALAIVWDFGIYHWYQLLYTHYSNDPVVIQPAAAAPILFQYLFLQFSLLGM